LASSFFAAASSWAAANAERIRIVTADRMVRPPLVLTRL
jgi:hypothetical protein